MPANYENSTSPKPCLLMPLPFYLSHRLRGIHHEGNNSNNMDQIQYFCLFQSIAKRRRHNELIISQPAFTCSKLTIETLEQGVKYVQS